MKTFSITNTAKSDPDISGSLFRKMKEAVLGKSYCLSVAFVTEAEIKKFNKIYRGKNTSTDILSFPMSKTEGEILICEKKATQKSRIYKREPRNFLYFLFIHGLVHLKGFAHGSRMEREEVKFRKKFGI